MGLTPFWGDVGHVLQYNLYFLPKTKMVRMVYRNNFYEMGLVISAEKQELWTKSKILERSTFWKIGFEVPNGSVRALAKTKSFQKILQHKKQSNWPNFE